MPRRYRFAAFELDAAEPELRRDGEPVPIQELPLRLLVALVERAPATVSRETLREVLWPPGTHLDVDASLNTAVARVRDALGDEAGAPRFVATVPRRGYRFLAPVEPPASAASPAGRHPPDVPTAFRRWIRPTAAALVVALGAAGAWYGLGGSRDDGLAPATAAAARDSPAAGPAREYLLVARHHAERRTREDLQKAIAAYQSAVALDPDSAQAYGGLASAYALLGIYDYWRPREAFGPARVMARRALELDPASAEAHLASALVAAVARWDWAAATAGVERAVALAPASPDVWLWRGALLSALGRHDQAIASTRRALELEPTSPAAGAALAWHLFQARRGEEAVAQARRVLELHPDYHDAWDNLKWIERTLGREAPAVEAWVRAEEVRSGDGAAVRRNYAAGGLERLHREAIARKVAVWEAGRYQPPYDLALEHAALGEVDAAMLWLERSFAERETDLIGLAVDPRLDPLREDPRFRELVERMALPEPSGAGGSAERDGRGFSSRRGLCLVPVLEELLPHHPGDSG